MASVLTDQYVAGSRAVVIAPVPQAATTAQFKVPDAQTGNFRVNLPVSLTSQRRYRVTVRGNVKASGNTTVSLALTDTAGTTTVVASSGAKANSGVAVPYMIVADLIIDPAVTAGTLGGLMTVVFGNLAPSVGALTATPLPVLTGTQPLSVSVQTLTATLDSTSVFNITELTAEIL